MNDDDKSYQPPAIRLPQERPPIGNLPIEKVEGLQEALFRADPAGGASGGGVASELHFNNGLVQIDVDANGISLKDLVNGNYFQYDSTIGFDWESNDLTIGFDPSAGQVFISNNAHSVTIAHAAITHDMAIKEIDVCSGGIAKKMLVLASDPY